jgi:3-dehydroquinate synthase
LLIRFRVIICSDGCVLQKEAPGMLVHVFLAERKYDVAINREGMAGIGSFARSRSAGARAFVVADANVRTHADALAKSLEGNGFGVHRVELPPGENQKCLASASLLYDRLAEMNADRKTLVVAVGGGVIGDLAGFVAATYNRGLPLLMAPTTLLAMVDSSVGGKVGVNHPQGKNLIGAFHQPVGVWIALSCLETLPEREFRSGLAEVVKYGVILDADFFAFLEQNQADVLNRDPEVIEQIIAVSCRLKAAVVAGDEREETGLRAVLNYGHTFAHAFETVGGYGAWLHGEAVAAGMICASMLAERMGRISSETTSRQRELLKAFQLPVQPLNWPVDDLLAVMYRDKKTQAGRLRLVLPDRLGHVELVSGVEERLVRETLSLAQAT